MCARAHVCFGGERRREKEKGEIFIWYLDQFWAILQGLFQLNQLPL